MADVQMRGNTKYSYTNTESDFYVQLKSGSSVLINSDNSTYGFSLFTREILQLYKGVTYNFVNPSSVIVTLAFLDHTT